MRFLALAFFALNAVSAYCGGFWEMKLVNEQKIGVDSVDNIEILYSSEDISLIKSNTDSLVIKEYMNKDNRNYYAKIANSGNKLTISKGERPYLWMFNARVEVYIPAQYIQNITIRASSGGIEAFDDYIFSRVILRTSSGGISVNTLAAENTDISTSSGGISVNTLTAESTDMSTSSGGIRCEKINGNVAAKTASGAITLGGVNGNVSAETSSGGITLGSIEGDVSAETSSGAIRGDAVNGNVLAKTASGGINIKNIARGIEIESASGSIYCSATEIVDNISLISKSGRIELLIPRQGIFTFSSRTNSGHLSTPFAEKLFMPVTQRGLVQGVIGEGDPMNAINMETSSGSMVVKYRS